MLLSTTVKASGLKAGHLGMFRRISSRTAATTARLVQSRCGGSAINAQPTTVQSSSRTQPPVLALACLSVQANQLEEAWKTFPPMAPVINRNLRGVDWPICYLCSLIGPVVPGQNFKIASKTRRESRLEHGHCSRKLRIVESEPRVEMPGVRQSSSATSSTRKTRTDKHQATWGPPFSPSSSPPSSLSCLAEGLVWVGGCCFALMRLH